ncbi:hypothetical protein C9374_006972 [Naegleria lovaniensis]|uniref:Fungal lipase-type domain-containing protein n=1 Tax=Naegleria lovaniensis TaxID=51637 RepID=A0AA88KRN4_NAELO|nr:uncharacterized protein C9374_006972 [Naegleria lovaniensis]KAG2393441.1 hypothetical protein C9374_006972 [Naegleria lovaniensis]
MSNMSSAKTMSFLVLLVLLLSTIMVKAASFDIDSLLAAHASEYAYDTTDRIGQVFKARDAGSHVIAELQLVQTIKHPAGAWCKTYVVKNRDTVIVSYRGSKTAIDWANNLNVDSEPAYLGPSSSHAGNVHEGFWDSYSSTKSSMISYLSKLFGPNTRIIFTGHSQGGAVAMIAALDFAFHHPSMNQNVKLITFGQPRTVKSDFLKTFNNYIKHYTRFVILASESIKDWITGRVVITPAQDDIVTTVPPKIFGFQHAGHRIDLTCPVRGLVKCHDMTFYLSAFKTKLGVISSLPQ